MRKPYNVWKDVYAIGGPDISDPLDCCIYLINAGGELVLIDSGTGRSCNQLVDNISSLGFNPKQLKVILITHAHIDHIGALAYFQEKYYVKLIAHELDAPAIKTGKGTRAYGN
jgi:glyoxylase-like metal-dependent hydrolase (beta-lactamase superfamily II)